MSPRLGQNSGLWRSDGAHNGCARTHQPVCGASGCGAALRYTDGVGSFAKLAQALSAVEGFAGMARDHELEPARLTTAAEKLREAVIETFGASGRAEFVGAAHDMAETGETAAAFRFFIEFDALIDSLAQFSEHRRILCRRVHAARLRTFLNGLDKFCAGAPGGSWPDFPRRLAAMPAAQSAAGVLARSGGEVTLDQMRRLVEPREQGVEADEDAFADNVLRLQEPFEAVYRFFWLSSRQPEKGPQSPAALFGSAWTEMLPLAGVSIGGLAVEAALDEAAVLASRCGLPEVADYLRNDPRVLEYGLAYFVPPSPSLVRIGSLAELREIFAGQVSSWYFHPFRHRITPIEMMGVVLNAGRPLYYERYLGHLLLQRALIDGVLDRCQAPDTLDWTGAFDGQIALVLDAYLLRRVAAARLKTPAAWLEYLDDLVAIHFPPAAGTVPSERLAAYRAGFLAERGAVNAIDLLWRHRAGGAPN
jgi:hypothetical protein